MFLPVSHIVEEDKGVGAQKNRGREGTRGGGGKCGR